jgi:hypothetical protein
VKAGLYEIINEENNTAPLTVENWEDAVVPGMELSMSIVLKQQQESSSSAAQNCPSCGDRYKGYGKCKDLERVRWYLSFPINRCRKADFLSLIVSIVGLGFKYLRSHGLWWSQLKTAFKMETCRKRPFHQQAQILIGIISVSSGASMFYSMNQSR